MIRSFGSEEDRKERIRYHAWLFFVCLMLWTPNDGRWYDATNSTEPLRWLIVLDRGHSIDDTPLWLAPWPTFFVKSYTFWRFCRRSDSYSLCMTWHDLMDQSWTWSLPRAKQLNSIFDVVYAVAVAIEIIHLICSYNLVWILFLFVSFSSFLFFPNVSEQFFSSEFNLHYDHSLVFFIRSVCLSSCTYSKLATVQYEYEFVHVCIDL